MDDLNMFRILADDLQELGHGVRPSRQNSIESGTLVCFLDRSGQFHFGFGFRNGSNVRVVCWENNGSISKTPPQGAFIIAFVQVHTYKVLNGNFNAEDFNFQWFGADARRYVADELRALNHHLNVMLNNVFGRLARLTLQELDIVNQTIGDLLNNRD